MTGRVPKPKNPLAPYYPSKLPSVPGNGRTWFAVLLTLVLLSGPVYVFVSFLATL